MIEVTKAGYLGGYLLHLEFNDGESGQIDLENDLEGEVFSPLKDPGLFSAVRVDEELGTITWPNGADLAPEFLHERISLSPKAKK